jgi:DNA-binding response OmpR family regulator
MAQILLVEDDDAIAETLGEHLRQAGFDVHRESDGLAALAAAQARNFDLVLLDGMLPGADGWDVCRVLRDRQPQLPILMLSARVSEAHRILGLELGADDYVAKPFSMLELVARVRAHLRRVAQWRSAPNDEAPLRLGPLELRPRERSLSRDGANIPLTLREFDLLHFLMRHPGDAFARDVNSHINRLRAKLEADPRQPRWLLTVWGVGYRLAAA